MPTAFGSLRRLVLTPSLAKVSFAGRGFPAPPAAATQAAHAAQRLEAIPRSVVCGFEWGIDARDQWEVERRVELIEPEQRGFVYEGVTMAFTVLDAMGGQRPKKSKTKDLLLGPAQPHIFLAYIGIGFAMARLPRPLWKKAVPDLKGSAYYPQMTWLAVDGYGFDRAYFDTRRWVDEQRRPAKYNWEGHGDYFLRAVDQGIGRALWFIHGARAGDVTTAVNAFAQDRHKDLWSGVGLAAAFAGGATPEGLEKLKEDAGDHHPEMAQGVVFATRARDFAGLVPEHTEAACAVLAGLSKEQAIRLADDSAVDSENAGPVPDYELWRQNVREYFFANAVTR